MGVRDTYQRVLIQACAIAGDETALARRIDVPVTYVIAWLLEEAPMPIEVFLRCVDIVLADTKRRLHETRALLDDIKRKHYH